MDSGSDFREFFEKWYPQAMDYVVFFRDRYGVRGNFIDTPEVDEQATEVWLKFYRAWNSGLIGGEPKAYLTRIARNHVVDDCRKTSRKTRLAEGLRGKTYGPRPTENAMFFEDEVDDAAKVLHAEDRAIFMFMIRNRLQPVQESWSRAALALLLEPQALKKRWQRLIAKIRTRQRTPKLDPSERQHLSYLFGVFDAFGDKEKYSHIPRANVEELIVESLYSKSFFLQGVESPIHWEAALGRWRSLHGRAENGYYRQMGFPDFQNHRGWLSFKDYARWRSSLEEHPYCARLKEHAAASQGMGLLHARNPASSFFGGEELSWASGIYRALGEGPSLFLSLCDEIVFCQGAKLAFSSVKRKRARELFEMWHRECERRYGEAEYILRQSGDHFQVDRMRKMLAQLRKCK